MNIDRWIVWKYDSNKADDCQASYRSQQILIAHGQTRPCKGTSKDTGSRSKQQYAMLDRDERH